MDLDERVSKCGQMLIVPSGNSGEQMEDGREIYGNSRNRFVIVLLSAFVSAFSHIFYVKMDLVL